MGAGIRVQQPDLYSILYDHERRLRNQETFGDERDIYVGTVGLDGVDALLTPDSPPFVAPWTNALGDESPVSFRRTLNGWIHIRGGFFGGSDETTIFVLPPGFRPEYRQPMVIPTSQIGHFATVVINVDGTVVYGTTV